MLYKWLLAQGISVYFSEWNSSALVKGTTKLGKTEKMFTPTTFSLIQATDFADRLENLIIPALKAGFYVLSDRYFYSVIARDIVRGADADWARKVYGFALIPDMVLYMRASVPTLVSRMVHGRGFNYWESGMDIHCADNLYDSFCIYQSRIIEQLDKLAEEYKFIPLDANQPINLVFNDLKKNILNLIHQPQE